MHPAVAGLGLEGKGLVLGAVLARVPPREVAARLPADSPAGCAEAVAGLAAAHRAGRAAALASLIALARASVPAGIERVHPGWLRERFVREPSEVVRAVAAGLPTPIRRIADEILLERGDGSTPPVAAGSTAVASALRRIVFAGLVPLDGLGAPTAPEVRALIGLSFAALDEDIERRGARTIGVSLRGAEPAVIARGAAGVGPRLSRVVLEAASQRGPAAERDTARRLLSVAAADPAPRPAWNVGARALGAELCAYGWDAARAVAQRLAPNRGRRLMTYALGEGA
jgi:hypothetical protein